MFLDAQMALNNPKIKFVYKYSKNNITKIY